MAQTYQRDSQLLSLAWTCAQGVTAAFKGDNVWYCFVILWAVYTMIVIQSTHMYRKPIYTDDYLDLVDVIIWYDTNTQWLMHFIGTKQARSHLTKVGWHKELKHILKVLAHSNNCYPSSLILYKYETLPLTSSVHDTAAIPIHTSYINQNSKSLFQFVWGKR